MKVLGIDPGYRTCGWTIIEDGQLVRWGSWKEESGSVLSRCIKICTSLGVIADVYQVDCYATEQFFSPKGKLNAQRRAAANYGRGMFDASLRLSLATLPYTEVHPGHLKKWVTGNGNAKKEVVAEQLLNNLSKLPVWDRLKEIPKTYMGHIAESWIIGLIGYWLQQPLSVAEQSLTAQEITVLRRVRLKAAWQQPWADDPVLISRCRDDRDGDPHGIGLEPVSDT